MSKITLQDVGTLLNETTALTTINQNSATLEDAFDNTLSLDGTSPNQMGADLDMNSNFILNLPQAVDVTSPVRLGDVEVLVAALTGISAGGTTGTGNVVLSNNPTLTIATFSTGPLVVGGGTIGGFPYAGISTSASAFSASFGSYPHILTGSGLPLDNSWIYGVPTGGFHTFEVATIPSLVIRSTSLASLVPITITTSLANAFTVTSTSATYPVNELILNNSSNFNFLRMTHYGTTATGGNGLDLRFARGSLASPADVVAGDALSALYTQGYSGSAFRTVSSMETYVGTGSISASSLPTYIRFTTTPNGAVVRSESLRLDQNGNTIIAGGAGAALATTATDGFLYLTTMAGTPTGNSSDYTGRIPIVYDTSANKLWVNTTGTTWKSVALT